MHANTQDGSGQLTVFLLHNGNGSKVEAAQPCGTITVTEEEVPAVEAQLDKLLADNEKLSDGEWWYSTATINLPDDVSPEAIARTFANAYDYDLDELSTGTAEVKRRA